MIPCRLTKIKGGAAVRTETFTGHCYRAPSVDAPFIMLGPPLDKAFDFRSVRTSPVVAVDVDQRVVTFRTEAGSVYEWVDLRA